MIQSDPIRPPILRAGDLVALVAPSGPVPAERVSAAVAVLADWGLRARVGVNALGRHNFFAGTDDERLADLNGALRDDQVRALLFLRGGYGAQRIVDDVDFAALRADPKMLMGFSDITALHLAVWRETGVATVHGPVAAQLDKGAESVTARGARRALMTGEPIRVHAGEQDPTYGVRVPGHAEGVLLGG